MKANRAIVFVAFAILLTRTASALIFFSTDDPEKNTAPPTGELAGSGWDLQGEWGNFAATPIGPRHFIAAAHIGGGVGQTFTFRGASYLTVSTAKDPTSDLRIWEVTTTFSAFAPLYDGPTETGADLVVFGRGARRGAEVTVLGVLKGWQWGTGDQRLRWGRKPWFAVSAHSGVGTEQVCRKAMAFIDAERRDAAEQAEAEA